MHPPAQCASASADTKSPPAPKPEQEDNILSLNSFGKDVSITRVTYQFFCCPTKVWHDKQEGFLSTPVDCRVHAFEDGRAKANSQGAQDRARARSSARSKSPRTGPRALDPKHPMTSERGATGGGPRRGQRVVASASTAANDHIRCRRRVMHFRR